jgi:hypothetical protein
MTETLTTIPALERGPDESILDYLQRVDQLAASADDDLAQLRKLETDLREVARQAALSSAAFRHLARLTALLDTATLPTNSQGVEEDPGTDVSTRVDSPLPVSELGDPAAAAVPDDQRPVLQDPPAVPQDAPAMPQDPASSLQTGAEAPAEDDGQAPAPTLSEQVLAWIEAHPHQTVAEIATGLGWTSQKASVICSKLAAKALIARDLDLQGLNTHRLPTVPAAELPEQEAPEPVTPPAPPAQPAAALTTAAAKTTTPKPTSVPRERRPEPAGAERDLPPLRSQVKYSAQQQEATLQALKEIERSVSTSFLRNRLMPLNLSGEQLEAILTDAVQAGTVTRDGDRWRAA